jgi:hypothetical protein
VPEQISEIWKYAPVLAVLVLILWAGHQGFWYWGRGVRSVIVKLEHERDEWRELAYALLREKGVTIEETAPPRMFRPREANGKPEDRM